MTSFPNFLTVFSFFIKFSFWFKFHVNIITGSGVTTIFFYRKLTKNPEVGNTPVWFLPDIWRLGRVNDTKFGASVSNKINKMGPHAAKSQGYSFYDF